MTSKPRIPADRANSAPVEPPTEPDLGLPGALDEALGFDALDVGSAAIGAPTRVTRAPTQPMGSVAPASIPASVPPAPPMSSGAAQAGDWPPGSSPAPRALIRPTTAGRAPEVMPRTAAGSSEALDRPIAHSRRAGLEPAAALPGTSPGTSTASSDPLGRLAGHGARRPSLDLAGSTQTAMRAVPAPILPRASVVSLVLLVQAFALPTAAGAPWELIVRPAEVTLQALAAFVLIGVVHLMPARERTRGAIALALAIVLLVFAFVAWRAAAGGHAFDAQPALATLFAGALPTPALPSLLALVLVPAGLFARGHHAPREAGWVVTGLGLFAALVAFWAMDPRALFGALSEAAFLGDRVAAWATLPLLLLSAGAALVAFWPRLVGSATMFGFLVWAASLVPLTVLALFSAKSDQWMHVLEPVKLTTFLGALTLYAAAALASVVTRPARAA